MSPRLTPTAFTFAIAVPLGALGALPASAADNTSQQQTSQQQSPQQQPSQQQANAAKGSRTSLQQGLSHAQSSGKPLSGTFDTSDTGQPVLVIETAGDNGYSEIAIDPVTGTVVHTAILSDAADVNAARSDKSTMDQAQTSLQTAADQAVNDNRGFVAVAIRPQMKDGHPVAEVTLVRGDGQTKTVEERLD